MAEITLKKAVSKHQSMAVADTADKLVEKLIVVFLFLQLWKLLEVVCLLKLDHSMVANT